MTDEELSLGHVPSGDKWEFDGSVAKVFDDMLERSIPDYANMRDLCYRLGRRFVSRETDPRSNFVLDLGCARGEALAPFVSEFGWSARYMGLEVSKPMLEAARERFKGMTDPEVVRILEWDLRSGLPEVRASLVLSVLTLQFVPINYRLGILERCYERLNRGGALILVEKVLGESGRIDEHLVEEYHAMKKRNGYTTDEIERKRLALEGVLVPITAKMNEWTLDRAGFKWVDCFWRDLNFAGWLAIK